MRVLTTEDNILTQNVYCSLLQKQQDGDLAEQTTEKKEISNLNEDVLDFMSDLTHLLITLKFTLYTKSTNLFIDAFILAFTNPILLSNMKGFYTELARLKNMSSDNVKWCLINAVKSAKRHLDNETLLSIFPYCDLEQTNSPKQMLTLLVEYFKENY